MITSLARQSVVIKCNMQKSTTLGNYEFYYGAGLLDKLHGLGIDEDIKPLELQEILKSKLSSVTPKDERDGHLIKIILEFLPSEEYDEQMKELLLWGKNEEFLWSINAS